MPRLRRTQISVEGTPYCHGEPFKVDNNIKSLLQTTMLTNIFYILSIFNQQVNNIHEYQTYRCGKAKDTLAVKRIITNGADLEGVDESGMTALLHACDLQSCELLKLMVDAGEDVNNPNAIGYQQLDIAYWQEQFRMGCYTAESGRMVSYLIRHGGKSFSQLSKPETKSTINKNRVRLSCTSSA